MGGRQDSPSARYCTCQNVMNAEPATGGGGDSFQNVYVGASSTSVTFGGFGGSEHMILLCASSKLQNTIGQHQMT